MNGAPQRPGSWFDGFEQRRFGVAGQRISARFGGSPSAPPLLLLHGFPETHAMWHGVARALSDRYFLVMPDLRGCGDSSKPVGQPDHRNYRKRVMAADAVGVMDALGLETFFVGGHDRGGRVAHRLALDFPGRVEKLCVLDIAPTLDMYDATDMAFATAYYHWFHLIQPAPLPEFMIGGDPMSYLHAALGALGGRGLDHVEPLALVEFERCFTPDAIHGMCEDYRASAGIDLVHDRRSREIGQRISCDVHVLWASRGIVQRFFRPLELWQAQCAGSVTGEAVPSGHFIPEELPAQTAAAFARFFTSDHVRANDARRPGRGADHAIGGTS